MLTDRVKGFLSRRNFPDQTLCVTHAVTMRLVYAVLADMLPSYPDWIPENGDIWEVDFTASGTPHEIIIHKLGNGLEIENRA
jgi:broad specificity phosphatase PhoE